MKQHGSLAVLSHPPPSTNILQLNRFFLTSSVRCDLKQIFNVPSRPVPPCYTLYQGCGSGWSLPGTGSNLRGNIGSISDRLEEEKTDSDPALDEQLGSESEHNTRIQPDLQPCTVHTTRKHNAALFIISRKFIFAPNKIDNCWENHDHFQK